MSICLMWFDNYIMRRLRISGGFGLGCLDLVRFDEFFKILVFLEEVSNLWGTGKLCKDLIEAYGVVESDSHFFNLEDRVFGLESQRWKLKEFADAVGINCTGYHFWVLFNFNLELISFVDMKEWKIGSLKHTESFHFWIWLKAFNIWDNFQYQYIWR